MTRIAIQDFVLANPLYVGKTVSFFTVDDSGSKTENLATLYSAATGPELLENPQKLDSEGKVSAPVYIDEPVIIVVTGLTAGDTETGIIAVTGRNRGTWVTGTVYYATELIQNKEGGAEHYNWYSVAQTHTSGVFADDLTDGKLELFVDTQQVIADVIAQTDVNPADYALVGHDHDGTYEPLNANILKSNDTASLSVGYTVNADTDLGLASVAVGGAITLNPATKPYQKITIDGDLVIAFHASALAPVRLTVINDATGGHAVSLDAATIYTPEGTYDPAPNKEFTFYLERDKTGGKATCYIVEKVAQ